MLTQRFAVLSVSLILLASAGCQSQQQTNDRTGAFVGLWEVEAYEAGEIIDEIDAAQIIIDEDGFVALIVTAAGNGDQYTVTGEWTQPVPDRIDASFIVDSVVFDGHGWMLPDGESMRVIAFIDDDNETSSAIFRRVDE